MIVPKTCPFCGGMPEIFVNDYVRCVVAGCPLRFILITIADWNRRQPDPATAMMLQLAKRQLDYGQYWYPPDPVEEFYERWCGPYQSPDEHRPINEVRT
jgi:hypothetical protein